MFVKKCNAASFKQSDAIGTSACPDFYSNRCKIFKIFFDLMNGRRWYILRNSKANPEKNHSSFDRIPTWSSAMKPQLYITATIIHNVIGYTAIKTRFQEFFTSSLYIVVSLLLLILLFMRLTLQVIKTLDPKQNPTSSPDVSLSFSQFLTQLSNTKSF